MIQAMSPIDTPLSWSRLIDAPPPRELKLILRPGEFRNLTRISGSCGYYRGRDAGGNAVTVQVVEETA
ncbi:MAG: hypothetical protein JF615_03850 [Asticcacaulis sp.]|nr:hypothetical protein [Asticcacaulis sp.]